MLAALLYVQAKGASLEAAQRIAAMDHLQSEDRFIKLDGLRQILGAYDDVTGRRKRCGHANLQRTGCASAMPGQCRVVFPCSAAAEQLPQPGVASRARCLA